MKNDNGPTEASKDYAAAYEVHYETMDLYAALGLYRSIIAEYQDTKEAGYSRSQIQNIINSTVPEQELFNAQVDMALAYLQKTTPDSPMSVR